MVNEENETDTNRRIKQLEMEIDLLKNELKEREAWECQVLSQSGMLRRRL